MKWPFVSRVEYESIVHELHKWQEFYNLSQSQADAAIAARLTDQDRYERILKSVNDRHDVESVRQEARYAELLQRFTQLKLQGFNEPAVIEPVKRDLVIDAVNQRTKHMDARARALMLKKVAEDRAANVSDADIIERIRHGNRLNDILGDEVQ